MPETLFSHYDQYNFFMQIKWIKLREHRNYIIERSSEGLQCTAALWSRGMRTPASGWTTFQLVHEERCQPAINPSPIINSLRCTDVDKLPFFSFHLLFFLSVCSFPPFPRFLSHSLWYFLFSSLCLTLKTLAWKDWHVELSGIPKSKKGVWEAFLFDVNSIPLFVCCVWPERWSPDGRKAAPGCKSGPCLLLTFRSLTSSSNDKHLLSSQQKYELEK